MNIDLEKDIVQSLSSLYPLQEFEERAIDTVLDAIPHWIPVTEELPEKSGRYFVTERIYHINDKEHTGGFILKTDFAEYSATEKKWRRAQALVVVAWMDNEPYKGVTE